MDGQEWQVGNKKVSIQEWIKSISDGTVPDALTAFDKHFSSSIGGFGNKLEYILDTNREVPIFEFRNLKPALSKEVAIALAETCEKQVVALHEKYRHPCRRRRFARAVQLPRSNSSQLAAWGNSSYPAGQECQ